MLINRGKYPYLKVESIFLCKRYDGQMIKHSKIHKKLFAIPNKNHNIC